MTNRGRVYNARMDPGLDIWDDADLDFLDEDFRQFLHKNRNLINKMHSATSTSNTTGTASSSSSSNNLLNYHKHSAPSHNININNAANNVMLFRSNSQHKPIPSKLLKIAQQNQVTLPYHKIQSAISQNSYNTNNITLGSQIASANSNSSTSSSSTGTTTNQTLNVSYIPKPLLSQAQLMKTPSCGNFNKLSDNRKTAILKRRPNRGCLPAIGLASGNSAPTIVQEVPLIERPVIVQSELIARLKGYKDETRPDVSCKAWGIYKDDDGQYIGGENTFEVREMASITKIMTCLVALKLMKRFDLNLSETFFSVSEYAISVNGTSACLEENQWYSAEDLLYGLMLPSGNDAANCLAENFGCLLYNETTGCKYSLLDIQQVDTRYDNQSPEYIRLFVREMNKVASALGLRCTQFANPHGLPNKNNRSTCNDLSKLTIKALKWKLFRRIVVTKSYSARYYKEQDKPEGCDDDPRQEEVLYADGENHWKNTNKLLDDGYLGVKTGITPSAGACLSSHYSKFVPQLNKHLQVVILVLGSSSTEDRFEDTQKILEWHIAQQEKENSIS